jgi:hypothetical protein
VEEFSLFTDWMLRGDKYGSTDMNPASDSSNPDEEVSSDSRQKDRTVPLGVVLAAETETIASSLALDSSSIAAALTGTEDGTFLIRHVPSFRTSSCWFSYAHEKLWALTLLSTIIITGKLSENPESP